MDLVARLPLPAPWTATLLVAPEGVALAVAKEGRVVEVVEGDEEVAGWLRVWADKRPPRSTQPRSDSSTISQESDHSAFRKSSATPVTCL